MSFRLSFFLLALAFGITKAPADPFARELVDSTFKMFNRDSTCTSFLVQRDADSSDAGSIYLVTAAHGLEKASGDTVILVLRKQNEKGLWERHDHTISVRKDKKPLWVKHPSEDIAALKVEGPLPVATPLWPESRIADQERLQTEELDVCAPLFLLTYPQRFESTEEGFPTARTGIVAQAPFPSPDPELKRFTTDLTTFAGDSGGPVFVKAKDGRALIIGLTVAQYHHEEKPDLEYEDRTIRHPLGLGAVVYSQLIRETLDLAAKGEPAPESEAQPEDPSAPEPDPAGQPEE